MNINKIRNIALMAVAILLIVFIVRWQTTARVKISIIPSDATVLIDNKKVDTSKTLALKGGKHNLTAKKGGFKDYETSFEVKSGSSKSMEVRMAYNNYVGYQWLVDHPEQQYELEGRSSRYIQQQNVIMRNDNPIISRLPYLDPQFRIDYGVSKKNPDTEGALAIYVQSYTPDGRQAALSWIKSQGYDVSTMEIIFNEGSQ